MEKVNEIYYNLQQRLENFKKRFQKQPHPAQTEDSKRLRVHPTVYPPNWIDREKIEK